MTTARKLIVDTGVTQFYHCISRCVRRAMLCGEGNAHRKQWIEERLRELSEIFAIDVCGFAIMDNHLHVLLRLDPARAKAWSDRDVVDRWFALCPPRENNGQRTKITSKIIAEKLGNADWIKTSRQRLVELGWFMRFLREPISRRANKEDGCTGAFWEGRFRSIAILDDACLLATCVYIDLNPLAAGLSVSPAKAPHTSLKSRVDHCVSKGKRDALRNGSPSVSKGQLEKGHWLFPIEDKRDSNGHGLAGMLHGLSLTGYLQLVDWSNSLVRPGKSRLKEEVPPILAQLRIEVDGWRATLERLTRTTKHVGAYFGTPDRLTDLATQRGRHFLKNRIGRDTNLTTPGYAQESSQ